MRRHCRSGNRRFPTSRKGFRFNSSQLCGLSDGVDGGGDHGSRHHGHGGHHGGRGDGSGQHVGVHDGHAGSRFSWFSMLFLLEINSLLKKKFRKEWKDSLYIENILF